MATMTKPAPEITRAAEDYLERYSDPLVMNTYLKVTILVLAMVCLALAGLLVRSQMALVNLHPLIIRINDVGRAEAIDYRNFQYRPEEAENKYYLTRWAELYFSRNRFTIERDQTNSLYFLNGDVQREVIDEERKSNIIADYMNDSTQPFVDVEVKNVKDKTTGKYIDHTEWHRCIVWGKLAEYAKTLKKGAHLSVEGELRSRERTDKKTGQNERVWEVRVTSILKLDRAEKAGPEEAENDEFNPEEEAA
ncbi:MAG: single-stranded DNA-binding protein [Terracidiphilus sp.]